MARGKSNKTIRVAVIGSIVFVLVLTLGTILTGLLATKDTMEAVESVSMLYLDELAGDLDPES